MTTRVSCLMATRVSCLSHVLVHLILVLFSLALTRGCTSPCVCDRAARSVVCSNAGVALLTNNLPSDIVSLAVKGSNSLTISFTHLRKMDLDNFPNLMSLTISHTQLAMIDGDAFDRVKNLSRLDLSFNRLNKLEMGTLRGLTSLRYLQLTGNEGFQLNFGVFQGLGQLTELYLGSMGLRSVSSMLFQDLHSLHLLDLSDNGLSELPADFAFPVVFQTLNVLDLSLNQLRELNQTLEPLMRRLTLVRLADNPWHCNCMLRWLKSYPRHIFSHQGHVVCDTPDELRFQILALIDNQHLTCNPPKVTCDTPEPLTEGETLRVKCQISGDPFPEVSWLWADGFNVTVAGDSGRGVVVNMSNVNGGETAEITVTALLAWNGTLHVKATNTNGQSHDDVDIIVYPITTTTTTTTTTTALITTPTPTTTPSHLFTSTSLPAATSSPFLRSSTPNTVTTSSTMTASSSMKEEGTAGEGQKTMLIISTIIAFIGLVSASAVAGVLFKHLSTLSRLRPPQMMQQELHDYFSSRKEKERKKRGNRVTPDSSSPVVSPRVFLTLEPGNF